MMRWNRAFNMFIKIYTWQNTNINCKADNNNNVIINSNHNHNINNNNSDTKNKMGQRVFVKINTRPPIKNGDKFLNGNCCSNQWNVFAIQLHRIKANICTDIFIFHTIHSNLVYVTGTMRSHWKYVNNIHKVEHFNTCSVEKLFCLYFAKDLAHS